jgi:hypothetical protein
MNVSVLLAWRNSRNRGNLDARLRAPPVGLPVAVEFLVGHGCGCGVRHERKKNMLCSARQEKLGRCFRIMSALDGRRLGWCEFEFELQEQTDLSWGGLDQMLIKRVPSKIASVTVLHKVRGPPDGGLGTCLSRFRDGALSCQGQSDMGWQCAMHPRDLGCPGPGC